MDTPGNHGGEAPWVHDPSTGCTRSASSSRSTTSARTGYSSLGRLRELQEGCDLIQGYFVSRPLPADKFESWLVGRTRDNENVVYLRFGA